MHSFIHNSGISEYRTLLEQHKFRDLFLICGGVILFGRTDSKCISTTQIEEICILHVSTRDVLCREVYYLPMPLFRRAHFGGGGPLYIQFNGRNP